MADLAGLCRVSSQRVPLVSDHRTIPDRTASRSPDDSARKADDCLTIPLRGESGDSVSTAVAFGGLVGGGRAFNDYGELLYDYLTIRFDGQDVPG